LTELPYTLNPGGSPVCLDWGKLVRARPKPTRRERGASGGYLSHPGNWPAVPALRREGLSTGPQGLNARGFWLPFRPIHMHFIGRSPDDPKPDSRMRIRPLIPIRC